MQNEHTAQPGAVDLDSLTRYGVGGNGDAYLVDDVKALIAQVREARPAGAAPSEALSPLDYRAQGREEALAIILAESAEDPFAKYTGWERSGAPDDEGGAYWKEDELRKLLHIGDRKHDAYDRAEAAYWEALGHKDEAARELLFAQQAPFYKPLHEFLAKHEAWDLMTDLKRAAHPAQQLPDEGERMTTAFGAWCPYKGSPDPWIVWQDAWKAALAERASSASAVCAACNGKGSFPIAGIVNTCGLCKGTGNHHAPTPASAPATQPAAVVDADGEVFELGQWWIEELKSVSTGRPTEGDQVRAVAVALRFADLVLGRATQRADSALPVGPAVKTWQERAGKAPDCKPKPYAYGWYWEHALAEIADWRALAQQAATSQPAPAEDARDAARYRWLRDRQNTRALTVIYQYSMAALDAAIDAAMHSTHQVQDSANAGAERGE